MHSAHDPIGAASARLLASGLSRPDRTFALRILGLLLDHADRTGVVRMSAPMLASEFDLDSGKVASAYLHLIATRVLLPAEAGWLIDGYDDYHPGAVNAGAAMAMIADLLEAPAPAQRERVGMGMVAARAFPVLSGVALVLLVLVAAAGGGRDPGLAVGLTGQSRNDAATSAQADDDEELRVYADERRSPLSATRRPIAVPPPPDNPPIPIGPPLPVPVLSADAAAQRAQQTERTETAAPAVPVTCPAGGPAMDIVAVKALPVSSRRIGASVGDEPESEPGWEVTVDGTGANAAERALVVDHFDVIITTDEGEQVVRGNEKPIVLRPGADKAWQVVTTTPLVSGPPAEEDVRVVVRAWRWAGTCQPRPSA